jgi:protease IV
MDYPGSDALKPPTPPPLIPSPPPLQPRRPKRFGIWLAIALVLAAFLVVSVGLNLQQFLSGFSPRASRIAPGPRSLQEITLEYNRSPFKIALVDVTGMIVGDAWDQRSYGMVSQIRDQLHRAAADDAVRAVILRIDSPGGEVLASDEISRIIREFQENSDKPVVASMGGLAASGGYYVAAPCQWIVANELTITGSIGVIMHGYNYHALLDKVGVKPQIYKSGRFKDMLSGSRPEEDILPAERRMVQDLIDQTFARFKDVVRQGRSSARELNGDTGRTLSHDWENYADGRIFSGLEAWEHGFVDELGNLHTAVSRAQLLADVPHANLVRYQRPFDLGSLFSLFGQSETRSIKIDLGFDAPKISPARLYFLPPALL